MEIGRREWLEVVRGEYLGDFIREGGAAVKVVVADGEAGRAAVRDALRESAEASGFQYAFVDAASTRVHLIDRIFHEVARQVDWDALACRFLARVLSEDGYRLPAEGDGLSLA